MREFKKHFIVLVVAQAIAIHAISQTVLIKQTVPDNFEGIDNNFGPNRGHFSYPFWGFGFHFEGYSHENDTIISPKLFASNEFKVGTRYRFKINRLFAFGIDLGLQHSIHRINLKDDFAINNFSPDVTKAKYTLIKVLGSGYFQINFDRKRGNQLGSYIDIGGFSSYNFVRRYSQNIDQANKEETKYVLKKLSDFEKLEYGTLVRFGRNIWAIYAKYRYSNSFKNKADIGNYELPRLTFGFEYFIGNI